MIERNNADALPELVRKAAKEFNDACTDIKTAKVGIVGEIFLEFNPYAQKNVTDWLIAQRLEVVPPLITDFFTQSFVNRETKNRSMLQRKSIPDVVVNWLYRKVQKRMDVFNDAASAFRYYTPFDDIFEKLTVSHKLRRVKTSNMGSLYQLTYILELKNPECEKELIDEMRCRNGNLDIVSNCRATVTEEL